MSIPDKPEGPKEVLMQSAPAPKLSHHEWSQKCAQDIVDNLNRNVMKEHEEDIAQLPPEIRALKTEAEWLKVPSSEILLIARQAKQL